MKKSLVFIFSIFGFISTANAIPVATVGNVDNFLGSCNGIPSSEALEIACINSFSAPTVVTDIQKFSQTPDPDEMLLNFELVDGTTSTYAFLLPEAWRGDYFSLKTGNLTPGPNQTSLFYVFQNLTNSAYAVVDLEDGNFPFDLRNVDVISHLSATQVSAVPLPGAVWMFMAAIGGLFGLRRFKNN